MLKGKLSPPHLPETPLSSAAATHLLPPNPDFPSACLELRKSGMFFAFSVVVLTDVDR